MYDNDTSINKYNSTYLLASVGQGRLSDLLPGLGLALSECKQTDILFTAHCVA